MATLEVTRTYQAGVHSFFDSLVTMLFNYTSHLYIINANEVIIKWYETGDPEHMRRLRQPLDDMNFGLGFSLPDQDEGIIIPVHLFLGPILAGEWPEKIGFASIKKEKTRVRGPLSDAESHDIIRKGIFGAAFATYYESQLAAIKTKFTHTTTNWPSELNFARVVRNAISHNGQIHFENLNAAPVTWRGLTFGPADNGRAVFDWEDGVGIGELILLFEDMDKALYPEHW